MPLFFIDYWYIVLVVPALILGLVAQARVSSTFNKYSKVKSVRGVSAGDVARRILDKNGLHNVRINRVSGNLTDHFDPRTNTVNLSESVCESGSVAAIGVAAHEVGHAIQHATDYGPIKVRSAIVPITNFGASISPILIILGFVFYYDPLVVIGIALYSLVALFQLVTLPVEFNASRRALATLESDGLLYDEELTGARKVLSAAALTYVAALVTSLASVLRLIFIYNDRRK